MYVGRYMYAYTYTRMYVCMYICTYVSGMGPSMFESTLVNYKYFGILSSTSISTPTEI